MEQVEIFYGVPVTVTERINAWLKKMKNKIEITRALQSSDEFRLTITIFYKDLI